MDNLAGKVAFVTGAASGIGFGMADAFGRNGMKLMLADIETGRLDEAITKLRERGFDAEGVTVDVASRKSLIDAAERTGARFGKVHLLCNNAGVTVNVPFGEHTPGDWDWVIDVNLMGVVHGAEAFLPLLRAHGEGAHIVNTASMAGLIATPYGEPYSGTKFAIVGLSESWAQELAPQGIGVSVLCPGMVQSRFDDCGRTRDPRYGPKGVPTAETPVDLGKLSEMISRGTPASVVGDLVVEAILANQLFIMTHPAFQPLVRARYEAMLAAFDRAAASPILPDEPGPTLPQAFIDLLAARDTAVA